MSQRRTIKLTGAAGAASINLKLAAAIVLAAGTAAVAQPTGACCMPDGVCQQLPEVICIAQTGTYHGDNTDCATTPPGGCPQPPANTLTPPNFTAVSRTFVFDPPHSQVLSGGFDVGAFRLAGTAAAAGGGNFQSDMIVEMVSPSGQRLAIGGESGIPAYPRRLRWEDLLISGTSPANSSAAGSFDGVYGWPFGPIDGEWTVNFWNSATLVGSQLEWSDVVIEPIRAQKGSGACCRPSWLGTPQCGDMYIASVCYRGGGTFGGAGSHCPLTILCGNEWGPWYPEWEWTTQHPDKYLFNATAGGFIDLSFGTTTVAPRGNVVRIDCFPATPIGTPTIVELWTRPGSYVGHDHDPAGWTLHETIHGVSSGPGTPVPLVLNAPITIEAGQTVGVYLIAVAGGFGYFTSLDPTFGDDQFSIFTSLTRTEPWGGTAVTHRGLSARVFYRAECYVDCDDNGVLNVDDFTCFINAFAEAQSLPPSQQAAHYANCNGSTTEPVLTIDDFTCFINEFAQGCP